MALEQCVNNVTSFRNYVTNDMLVMQITTRISLNQ